MRDDLFRKFGKARYERKSKELKTRSETWLIVCEGKKTEPNYFNNHFAMLNTEVNLKNAMKNSKQLFDSYKDKYSPADRAPCTTVFQLVEEIEKYIGMKLC